MSSRALVVYMGRLSTFCFPMCKATIPPLVNVSVCYQRSACLVTARSIKHDLFSIVNYTPGKSLYNYPVPRGLYIRPPGVTGSM